jgi:hypothetical protein
MAIRLPNFVDSSTEFTKSLATCLQKPVAIVSRSFSRIASTIECIANFSTVLFLFVSLALQLPNPSTTLQYCEALNWFLEDSIDGCNGVVRRIPDFPTFSQDAAPLPIAAVIPNDPRAAHALCLGSFNALIDFRRLFFLEIYACVPRSVLMPSIGSTRPSALSPFPSPEFSHFFPPISTSPLTKRTSLFVQTMSRRLSSATHSTLSFPSSHLPPLPPRQLLP